MRYYQDGIQEGSVVRKTEKEKLPTPMTNHQAGMNGPKMGLHPSVSTAAVTLNKSTEFGSAVTKSSLLNLQKQQGNHYVQRVVSLSMQAEAEADTAPPNVQQAIESSRGGGQPLDSGVRVQMNSAFNADFGGVRVHADSQADGLNRALNARAFTTGKDVFFRQGEYNPGSSGGKQLLAHELTHVVQQNPDRVQRQDKDDISTSSCACGGAGKVSRAIQTKLTVGRPGDIYEQEADRMAQAFPAWEQRGSQTQDSAANVRRVMPEEEKKKEEMTVRSKPQDGLLSRQPEEEKKKEEMHAVQAKFDGTNIQRQGGEEEEEG
jgi:hypothetical protein